MIRTVRWVTVLAALAASAAVYSACGGGGSSNSSKTSAAGTTPASGTPASGATTAATASSSNGGGGSGELADVASKFAKSTFHATYKVSGSGADALSNGQLVMYKDGNKRLRFEATVNESGQTTGVIFISTETVSAFCLKDAGELGGLLGIEPGKGVCFKSDPSDKNNPVASISSLFQDLETSNMTVLDKSSRTIAGKNTTCYHTKDNSTGEVSTACFTSDGVLMYTNTEGTDAFDMEATDVSGSVSNGDFDLPYEVRDFPSVGGG